MISAPIRVTSTPKKEIDSKLFVNETLEVVNHEAHILATNGEAKHPAGEVDDIEITCLATNGGL